MEQRIRRVVVTGLGVISPVGNTVAGCWDSLTRGVHGIRPITCFDTTNYKAKLAAQVRDFDPRAWIDKGETLRSDLYAQYAMGAACQAVEESGVLGTLPPDRVAATSAPTPPARLCGPSATAMPMRPSPAARRPRSRRSASRAL